MDVGFYHLTRTPLEEALPALLGRTLDAGERALVRCPDAAAVMALDTALWACRDPVWLPHGSAKNGHAARQPIWLTEGEDVPNGARFLFRVDGAGGMISRHLPGFSICSTVAIRNQCSVQETAGWR